ncbi:MAG: GAF domain-containing protein [Chloroflexota bacterium]
MGSRRQIRYIAPGNGETSRAPTRQAREKLMTSIARVAATLNAEHDPEKALELICREARALFAAHTVILWEPQGDHLAATSALGGLGPQMRGYRVPVDDPNTFACRCFRDRAPVLENDLVGRGNPVMAQLDPAAAVLCVPLIHREQVLGVLALRDCVNPQRYTQADLEAAVLFSDLAAVAIANARLQEEAERRAQEAAVLSRISRIVASGLEVAETSESFARELRNLIFFHRVAIALLEGPEHSRIFLATGLDAEELTPGAVRPLAGSGVEWVVRQRRPHVIYDLELEQAFPSDRVYAAARMRSVVRVPLIERGEPLGALTLVSATPGAYGVREVELLEQVAGQIAGVFANAQMVEIERGLLSRLSSLHRVTDAALAALDLDSLLDALLERCIEIVGADSGIVLLLDEAGEELSIRGGRWMSDEKPWDFRRKLGEGISGKVARDGVPRLVLEVDEEDPADMVITRRRGIHSILAMPLKARGRTTGVFRLESRRPGHFDRQHLQLMEVVAERIALAIDNARLLQEAREGATHEALIHRIASAIGSSLDLDQVMNTAAKELRSAANASRCVIALAVARDGNPWARWDSSAEGLQLLSDSTAPWRDGGTIRAMMASLEPTVVEDVEREILSESMLALARMSGVRSVLATPLFRGEEPIGGLVLFQHGQPRRWTKREVELVKAVAAQLSVAAENARLYGETDERLRARVRELGSLLRLSKAVSEQLSLDVVIERAVEEGVRALNADRCTITTVDWERRVLEVRAARHGDGENGNGVGLELRLDEFPHSARALAERVSTVLTIGHPTASASETALLRRLGMDTAIVVPLAVGDRAIGTAFFGRKADKPLFSEEEAALARAMAGQVAVAMENARLFQEVQAQKARTDAMLSSMSEGVYATDGEGRIVSVNPWLEAMVGRRAEDMVGRLCREVLRHTDEEGNPQCDAGCPLKVALEEGKVTDPTLMFTHTDWGERLPTTVSVAPIRDGLREISGAVAVLRDVSRDWQMDKLKSNIISVVSHEFRTPLTSIIGFSELLLTRDQSTEERHNCAEYIYNEGLKLEALVNDFLDVSRLDAGRVVLNPEPLEPAAVVERSVSEVQARAGERRLLVEVQGGLPLVEADPERLGQVLENLLSNAIKYSLDGSEIVVRARQGWEDNRGCFHFEAGRAQPWVVFTVEDHGFGIPGEQLFDIFTPFHRVEGELTRRIRGTGLGLSIVKSLVELHGGKVWVESEVGAGSRFHVALPAVSRQLMADC